MKNDGINHLQYGSVHRKFIFMDKSFIHFQNQPLSNCLAKLSFFYYIKIIIFQFYQNF